MGVICLSKGEIIKNDYTNHEKEAKKRKELLKHYFWLRFVILTQTAAKLTITYVFLKGTFNWLLLWKNWSSMILHDSSLQNSWVSQVISI